MTQTETHDEALESAVRMWKAEHALEEAGVESFGPRLTALSASLIEAVDDCVATTGIDAAEETLEAIVAAHVGPEAICPVCLFSLAAESPELLLGECVIEAETEISIVGMLGGTVFGLAYEIADNELVRQAMADEVREELADG